MDKTTAQRRVRETFNAAFDKKRYRDFINELCNGFDEAKAQTMLVPHAFLPHVKSCQRLGTFESSAGELADILTVQLTDSQKLERTRTGLRDFVAHKLKRGDGDDNSYKEAALVAFVAPDSQSWRFSYVRMEYATKRDPKTGKIRPEERLTPARRYSYLVGVEEQCHTAQSRFLALLQNTSDSPTLSQIEEAFSVESVTEEFFREYFRLFGETEKELIAAIRHDKAIRDEFAEKGVRPVDFAKKLLAQIVFLYFIQKKGWLGIPKGGQWGNGPRDFIRQLADRAIREKQSLFDDVLEPLFYETLATDRGHEAWCKALGCRIPFLNGGLFEPLGGYDWEKTKLALPNALFTNQTRDLGTGILDVFDRFNFTVNEADPLEQEVAIDPEMLGKVFENLIEDNRRKGLGAFYTPREIVHFMCQESLINYLDTALNHPVAPIAAATPESEKEMPLFVDSSEKPKVTAAQGEFTDVRQRVLVARKDLEVWIRQSDQFAYYAAAIAAGTKGDKYYKPPDSIRKFAYEIDVLLRDVTVCDPAIGSGAFPVGMMTEIVRARLALTPYFNDVAERTAYHFKRHIIQFTIHGVDVDPSAVEIAKLRLWLSLVVDEDDVQQIKPLPNLDYKVVVGNSLLGFPFKSHRVQRIEKLKDDYFDETDHEKKKRLKREIDSELALAFANSKASLGYEVTFDFQVYFSEIYKRRDGFDVVIANPPYIGERGHKDLFRKTKEGPLREFYMGKMDYFYFFFHLALHLARPRGEIAFITTNYYLTATGAKKLREDFKRRAMIRRLINLNELRIFESAQGQHNIVSLLRKGKGEDFVRACVTNRMGQATPDILSVILRGDDKQTRFYEVGQAALYDGQENYIRLTREDPARTGVNNGIESILDKVAARGEPLGRIANINQGVLSGCDYVSSRNKERLPLDADVMLGDGIFVFDLENHRDREVISRFSRQEKALLRFFVKNTDVNKYFCEPVATKRLLYYQGELRRSEFPNVYAHLWRFKNILEARLGQYNEDYHWTSLHRPREEAMFYSDKIIVPYRAERNTFAFSSTECFCVSDCFVITQKLPNYALGYLMALLNSSLYFKWLFHRGKRKGKMLELIKNPLSEIPIMPIGALEQEEFSGLTELILAARRHDPNANTSKWEQAIDTKVFDLYGLNAGERELVLEPVT